MKLETLAKALKWFLIYIALFSLGFILGIIYQQYFFTLEATYILKNTDVHINVNLNGTKFAQELNETFIPAWKQAFNETIKHQYNITT